MYFNKATVIGNLTRDPELKALPNGGSVTSFSIATNRVFKDRDGKRQEAVDYHNIVVFGRQAETCAEFLKKGSQALVEGRMQTRSWEADGVKHYRTEIVGEIVQFGSRPKSTTSDASTESIAAATGLDEGPSRTPQYPDEDISPEDIPF